MSDDEDVAVLGCAPCGVATSDGDTVDAVDEGAAGVAVAEQDVGVVQGVQVGQHVPEMALTVPFPKQAALSSSAPCQPMTPVRRDLAVLLRLFAALLHVVPPGLDWQMQDHHVCWFCHSSVLFQQFGDFSVHLF